MLTLRAFTLWLVCSLATAAYAQGEPSNVDVCLSAHQSAQLARRKGQFLEAQRQLLQCAQAACPRLVRNDCVTWTDEVSASTPSLVLAVRGSRGEDLSAVRVLANGTQIAEQLDGRALEVDPGVYKLRFEAAGHIPREETISVHEGEKTRLLRVQLDAVPVPVVAMPTVAPEKPRRVWSPVAITLGSAALTTGAAALVLGVWGHHQYDDARDRCGHHCSESDVEPGKRAYIAADVLASLAGASAIAAAWMFVHDNRERATQVSALPSRDGLRVSLKRAF